MPVTVSTDGELIEFLSVKQRSEAVSDIISRKPSFIVRYGIFIFIIILFILIGSCWLIQYPDTIIAKAKLNSINAPRPIVAKLTGKLIKIFIKENDQVSAGEIIGYMESTAAHEQVIALSIYLDSLSDFVSKSDTREILAMKRIAFKDLGELQQFYQTFRQTFTTFSYYLPNGFYSEKKVALSSDMKRLEQQCNILNEQKQLQERDLSLYRKTFDANETLKNEKIISELEYRAEQSKLLNKQMVIPQLKETILANEGLRADKRKESMELDNAVNQQKDIFRQAINTFKSEIEEWKLKYLLIAPADGNVFIISPIQEKQEISASQTICYIKSDNSTCYAEMVIPQTNFGKVLVGQEVLLKFDAYPDAEFGSLLGEISSISSIATDSGYLAKVKLPKELITNFGKKILFKDGLLANAQIITRNVRLLQRIFYSIYNNVKRQ